MHDIIVNALIQAGIAALVYLLYNGAVWLKNFIIHSVTIQLELTSDQYYMWQVFQYYVGTKLSGKIRHWKPSSDRTVVAASIPVPVRFDFEGKVVRLLITEIAPTGDLSLSNITQRCYRATLWVRNVDSEYFGRFIRAMEEVYNARPRSQISVCQSNGVPNPHRWTPSRLIPRRSLDSITMNPVTSADVFADLRHFLRPSTKQFYVDRGIAYRRGYLLTGPPGNGKSTFISVVASMLGSDICRISLNGKNMDDQLLSAMISGAPPDEPPCVLVLEDIDCLFGDDRKAQETHVTFSGLLNALDGVGAAENAIVFMTTNHPEKLDPALIRPGRVDKQVVFEPPSDDSIVRHYLKFFPHETPSSIATQAFLRRCREQAKQPCSMATVQNLILGELGTSGSV